MNVDVIERDNNHAVIAHANVLLLLWYGPQEPEVCLRIYDIALGLARRSGTGKMAAVSVVLPGAKAPSAAAREALGRLHGDSEHVVHRAALVFANDGFVGAIIRSIALSVRQASTRRSGHEVFQSLNKALQWATDGLPTANGRPISIESLTMELDNYESQRKTKVA